MTQHQTFDAIVLGVGSMGAATCFYLAQRGLNVLGLEQFSIPHELGSHAGQSRIIRKAYFEHPDYVPLLERAYQNWSDLEKISGTQVYFPTGLLYLGAKESEIMNGVQSAAQQYQIPIEAMNTSQAQVRYPQIAVPPHYKGIYEPEAGFITPERAILLYVEQAIRQGALIKTQEKVQQWQQNTQGLIEVHTDKGKYLSKKLVITAGPWAGQFLPVLKAQLKVTRQVLAWVIPQKPERFALGQFPCWLIDDEAHPGALYGFPMLPVGQFNGPIGFKLGYHSPGMPSHPDGVDRQVSTAEEQILIEAVQRFFPEGYASTHVLKTCLYTYTPDENFVIDFLPGHEEQIAIAAGFSGHGFKFASAVGEVLADLVLAGRTNLPIEFLNARRFEQR
jgi:sarcosine oxidase